MQKTPAATPAKKVAMLAAVDFEFEIVLFSFVCGCLLLEELELYYSTVSIASMVLLRLLQSNVLLYVRSKSVFLITEP
jgi:hypothetical protein